MVYSKGDVWFCGIYEALFWIIGSVLYKFMPLKLLYCFIHRVYGVFMKYFLIRVMESNGSGSQEGIIVMLCGGGFAEFIYIIFLLFFSLIRFTGIRKGECIASLCYAICSLNNITYTEAV